MPVPDRPVPGIPSEEHLHAFIGRAGCYDLGDRPARPERRRPVEYTSVAGVLTGQAGHFELYRCTTAFRGKRQGQLAGIPPVQNVNVRFRNTNGLVVGAISKGCEYLWLVFSPKGLQGIGISADVYVSDLRQTR